MAKPRPTATRDRPSAKADKAAAKGDKPYRRADGTPARPTLSFSRVNAIWLGAGAAAIVLGFFLLARGSMTIAPVLLVLGYCVLLPIGIIKK